LKTNNFVNIRQSSRHNSTRIIICEKEEIHTETNIPASVYLVQLEPNNRVNIQKLIIE